MDKTIILLLLYVDICIGFGFYMYLWRIKKLIGFHLGMNISIVMGGMIALIFGVLLILQFPFHFTLITVVSTLTGLVVGAMFGLLFDYQTFVTGLTNGIVVGLMSPMIGTIIEMPSVFVWCIHIFFAISLCTISISIKRS
ncbi:hypothetical protein FITA111629_03285 [Filibacter tadaridae]|uniref:Uncharacterized protein n=1 Tax=Filibacter tadaridae TaxID=2483811 RepID=A0A3P5X0J5_9BACL|nr:hypothetical protein [Filibacter tadaridae]VDC27451.1 hypothetical protein FILTAD_01575 [Filibacter tadaridae]